MLGLYGIITFVVLFIIFAVLGFYGAYWRRGNLDLLHEWGLAGRRLGTILVWFLMGADLYTAYTFIAVPSGLFAKGSLYFFAVPYVSLTFAIALLTMPRLWVVSRNKGYVTAADFVKDRFNSKILAALVALTGVVAELPYIALQIVGMKAVLEMMLLGIGNIALVSEISLIIAFIILAAFTFTSGLRGAALTGVFKDILIWITVISIITIVPLKYGGFSHAFSEMATKQMAIYSKLAEPLIPAYWSLFLGSALALYLYPHAINGSLSADDKNKLMYGTALLPIYGIGLAIIALFGILIYAVPNALNIVKLTHNGALVVPALIVTTMPDWAAGIMLLGIFVGGLVPAAIMAIASANLLVRNVIKEIKTDLTFKGETDLAKWISAIIKFIALAFVFLVPETYAINLQLLGGIIIAQTLPAVFLGLYTDWFNPWALTAGWATGIISGVYMFVTFGLPRATSVYPTPFGLLYVAVISLAFNLIVSTIGTLIARGLGYKTKSNISAEELKG
ncbi:MAG: sodium:solute symporter [Saccharolobus sp.]|jgi:SSS family solute:Na+ symporter|uniref:sodium:solute symporter family protein n=1 Tax=Saccharolobus sp. TaxID=2100761 RepID=UPI0028CD02EB|nr:sodium:solute symporter [Saccharolobus sp.]MDT7862539.1 sodium:solute symporter [Saccharolobus sp.]